MWRALISSSNLKMFPAAILKYTEIGLIIFV